LVYPQKILGFTAFIGVNPPLSAVNKPEAFDVNPVCRSNREAEQAPSAFGCLVYI
jgi:hypothetical protein